MSKVISGVSDKRIKQVQELIKSSQKILFVGHFNPDLDAFCAALGLAQLVKTKYPNKECLVNMEGLIPERWYKLAGSIEISNQSTVDFMKDRSPDLLVFLDSNEYRRFSKEDDKLKVFLDESDISQICIDHHEVLDKNPFDVYVNFNEGHQDGMRSSTIEVLYLIFIEDFGFDFTYEIAKTWAVGVLAETARFRYYNPFHRDTFRMMSDFCDKGVRIDKVHDEMFSFPIDATVAIQKLFNNLVFIEEEKYCYSFLTNDELKGLANDYEFDKVKHGILHFKNEYVKGIEDIDWGFVVHCDLSDPKEFHISFRGKQGKKDLSVYARAIGDLDCGIGGGGHAPSAGASLRADSLEEAIEIVLSVTAD
jgi:nanoRNase/pAp phosphatase (c-di-AMP/oligoRNAs hydrolase)